jgi:hypothetical protein
MHRLEKEFSVEKWERKFGLSNGMDKFPPLYRTFRTYTIVVDYSVKFTLCDAGWKKSHFQCKLLI